MRNRFKNKWYGKHSKFGFTLIEVLVAIAILALLAIPLAQTMISSAQINSKSKNMGSASDMAQTVAESMQATKLGNVLTEINGYNTNSVGYEIFNNATGEGYSFLNNALQGYAIEDRYEVMLLCPGCAARLSSLSIDEGICEKCSATISDENITYVPVVRQSDPGVQSDADVTSSIKTRTTTSNVVRTYFTGNEDDTYDFVLKNIATEEANYDVLVHVEPEQTLQIADIASMSSSDLVNIVQKKTLDANVAETFFESHQLYCSLNRTSTSLTIDDFRNQMTRQITVDIRNDAIRGTTVITVKAVYTAPDGTVDTADKYITKTVGSFTTNSTAELADGVYFYYYPLRGTTSRDVIVVNNPDSMAIKVYLIVMNDDTTGNYNPILQFSDLTPTNAASSTIFCSNLPQDDFASIPVGSEIRTLSNTSEEQTLYSMDVKVYTHKDSSFEADGTFKPNDQYLLVDTNATLLDSSERFDINVDTEFGNPIPDDEEPGLPGDEPGLGDDTLTPGGTKGYAEASGKNYTYDGTEHDVTEGNTRGSFVEWSGTTKATDAGMYYAYAKPLDGHTWPNGTTGKRQITWIIQRANDATAEGVNAQYDGTEHTGYVGTFVTATGDVTRVDAGHYTIYVTPEPNHAWEDGTYGTKEITWSISPKAVILTWETGLNKDSWQYDGNEHSGTCTVSGMIPGDEVNANIRDNRIIEVGKITAKVTSLTNPNYALPDNGTTHDLSVFGASVAEIVMKDASNGVQSLIYNGQEQTGVASSVGVAITGTKTAIDAGTYEITATPLPGYAWDAAGNDRAPRDYSWSILQKEVTVQWGTLTWDYDGIVHSTTCKVTNLVEGTDCDVDISNNAILDAGTEDVVATLENKNYKFPDNPPQDQSPEQTLTVNALPDSTYKMSDVVVYDGQVHNWGTGSHIQIQGVLSHSDAGTYQVEITPTKNHTWDDGTTRTIVDTWTINNAEMSMVFWDNYCYTGEEIIGVTKQYCDWGTGDWKATRQGTYSIQVTPSKNYAWAEQDGYTYRPQDRSTRTITWKIVGNTVVKPDPHNPLLNFGNPITSFEYNGQTWSPLVSTIDGTLPLTDAVFQKNPYYTVTGVTNAIEVGNYTAVISLKDKVNSQWASGGTDDVVINWSITKRKITLQTIAHVGDVVYYDRDATTGNNAKTTYAVAYGKQWDGISFDSSLKLKLASSATATDGDIWLIKDEFPKYDFDYKDSIQETSPLAKDQKISFVYDKSANLRNTKTPVQDVNKQTMAGVYIYCVIPTIKDAQNNVVTHNYEITYDFAHLMIDKQRAPIIDDDDPVEPEPRPWPTPILTPKIEIVQSATVYNGQVQNLITVKTAPTGGTLKFMWEHIGYQASGAYGTAATLTGKTSKLPGVTSGFTKNSTNGNFNSLNIQSLVGKINNSTQAVMRPASSMWTATVPTGITESKGTTYTSTGTQAGKYAIYYYMDGDDNHEDYWSKTLCLIIDVAQANQNIIVDNHFDKCHNRVTSTVTTRMQEKPAISYTTHSYIKTPSLTSNTAMGTNLSAHAKATGSKQVTTITSNGTVGNASIKIQAAATENYKAGTATINLYCRDHLHSGVVRDALNHRCSGSCSVGLHSPGTYSQTCTKDGNYHYDCQECKAYRNEVRPAWGHSFSSSSGGGPWCTSSSWVTITCTRCGYSNTTTIPAAYSAHKYNEWGSYGSDHRRNCYNVVGSKTIYIKDDTGKVISTKSYKIICRYTQTQSHSYRSGFHYGCCGYSRKCAVCSHDGSYGYSSCGHSGYRYSISGRYQYKYCRCCGKQCGYQYIMGSGANR